MTFKTIENKDDRRDGIIQLRLPKAIKFELYKRIYMKFGIGWSGYIKQKVKEDFGISWVDKRTLLFKDDEVQSQQVYTQQDTLTADIPKDNVRRTSKRIKYQPEDNIEDRDASKDTDGVGDGEVSSSV